MIFNSSVLNKYQKLLIIIARIITMWNLRPGSKIIDDKIKQRNYELHRKNVKSMRSLMKVEQPYQPDFVYAKWKLELTRKDRRSQIDRHNQILVNKINQIKISDYDTNKLRPQAQNLKTLNQIVMNETNQQIVKENKRICEKLLKTRTFYPTDRILDKTDELQRVRFNISYNARRAQSAHSRSTRSLHRPKSGYTTYSSAKKQNFDPKYSSDKLNVNQMPTQEQQNYKIRSASAKQFIRSGGMTRPESAPSIKRLKKIVVKQQAQ